MTYTFFLNLDDTTYINQFEGENPEEALRNWIMHIDLKLIKGVGGEFRQFALDFVELKEGKPITYDNMKNVWQGCFLYREKLIIVDFVPTITE